MTDLKTANADLAAAIAALESAEHAADLTEAAAIRDRLSALDERIGGRMRAKIEAHRAIVAAWGMSEAAPELDTPDEPIAVIDDPLAACDAAAWDARLAAIDADAGKAAGIYSDWLAQQKTNLYVQDTNAAPTAAAWDTHHAESVGTYALSGDDVPEAVLVNGAVGA